MLIKDLKEITFGYGLGDFKYDNDIPNDDLTGFKA